MHYQCTNGEADLNNHVKYRSVGGQCMHYSWHHKSLRWNSEGGHMTCNHVAIWGIWGHAPPPPKKKKKKKFPELDALRSLFWDHFGPKLVTTLMKTSAVYTSLVPRRRARKIWSGNETKFIPRLTASLVPRGVWGRNYLTVLIGSSYQPRSRGFRPRSPILPQSKSRPKDTDTRSVFLLTGVGSEKPCTWPLH